jgi:trehalose 2-sulfotransferase
VTNPALDLKVWAMLPGPPSLSYIIWFSQRVGSTLLTQTLEDTGIAGRPREWLNAGSTAELLGQHGASNARELRDQLWRRAMTDNGVMGAKYGMSAELHRELTSLFAGALPPGEDPDGRQAWEAFFPRSRHVFMTRRNKLRLAVSWWRAIRSQEWHRPSRTAPTVVDGPAGRDPPKAPPPDLVDQYDRKAIESLLIGADLREADMQEQFERWGVVPYTIVYEDLIASYEPTVRALLDFLEIPGRDAITIPAPAFARLADEVSETWYRRFRTERA